MPKPGMIQLETAHFSTLTGTIQRTSGLPGGAIRGLPGGVVVDGLPGVAAFASSIADAQKEFQLGRVRVALERIRQLETGFNGIASRWNATTTSVITHARQGRNEIGLPRLNELKNAQIRMQQLIRPAEKAFRDLVTALEHEIAMEGRQADQDEDHPTDVDRDEGVAKEPNVPAEFAERFTLGEKLKLKSDPDGKTRVSPALRRDACYLIRGTQEHRVAVLDKLTNRTLMFRELGDGTLHQLGPDKIVLLLNNGVWQLSETKT